MERSLYLASAFAFVVAFAVASRQPYVFFGLSAIKKLRSFIFRKNLPLFSGGSAGLQPCENLQISPRGLKPRAFSFSLWGNAHLKITFFIKSPKFSLLQDNCPKSPAKSHVKPQNSITKRKQKTSPLRGSYLQSTTLEIDRKKPRPKTGAFLISTDKSFRKKNLPVTYLE